MSKFNLPESFEEQFEHYTLPAKLKNVGVMNDLHIPFHNLAAMEEAIEYFIIKKVDALFLNGDVLDCYQLSKFQPDPRKRKFSDEILAFQQFIKVLQKNVTKNIFFKLGNHEERYERIMITRAPEFLGISEFDFENVLGCKELGVTVIKDQRIVYVGNLPVIHGHEIGMKYANVNPARTLFLKTYKSSLCGHLHRTSQHNEQSLDGKIISCWSVGHLGDPHPLYRRINNWNHGIARIEKDSAGEFEVINIRLMKNKLFRT
jgi:predicted phosphodiesterase